MAFAMNICHECIILIYIQPVGKSKETAKGPPSKQSRKTLRRHTLKEEFVSLVQRKDEEILTLNDEIRILKQNMEVYAIALIVSIDNFLALTYSISM